MRKLLIGSLLVFIGIIVFQSCGNKTITAEEKDSIVKKYLKEHHLPESGTTGKDYYCDPCNEEARSGLSEYLLDTTLLVEMAGRYKNTLTNPEDSRSIWFSLERLKKFIVQIEGSKCVRGCTEPLNLGIRMYYGRYPDPKELKPGTTELLYPNLTGMDPVVRDKHTVFLIPTFDDNTGLHQDFDPRVMDKKDPCLPTPLDGLLSTVIGMTLTDRGAMNHGDLIPPPYPAPAPTTYKSLGAFFLEP